MEHDEQLAWEARAGRPAAVAAFATGLLAVASGFYLAASVSDREDGADGLLESAAQDGSHYITAGVLQAVGLLLLIPVLLYVFRAARHRRPETMPAAAVLALLGGLTLAVVTVLRQIELVDIAEGFWPEKAEGVRDVEQAAEDELDDNLSAALQGIGLGAAVALAFSIVMIALNAMRAGLLSRFMGVLGIIVGVVIVIPLGTPILQLFWFVALGLMFLNRWPGGRGPAWQTGEAIPWPGAAEQREEIERRRAEREGAAPAADEPDDATDEPKDHAAAAEPETAGRPRSRKRKKKRR